MTFKIVFRFYYPSLSSELSSSTVPSSPSVAKVSKPDSSTKSVVVQENNVVFDMIIIKIKITLFMTVLF